MKNKLGTMAPNLVYFRNGGVIRTFHEVRPNYIWTPLNINVAYIDWIVLNLFAEVHRFTDAARITPMFVATTRQFRQTGKLFAGCILLLPHAEERSGK
jgi:hypothetical protein